MTDVTNNQKNFKINSYKVSSSFPVTINFSGRCPFRNKAGDGCAQVIGRGTYSAQCLEMPQRVDSLRLGGCPE